MKSQALRALLLAFGLLTASSRALADTPEVQLRIKDHKFEPALLEVPADTKVKLIIKNEDATPEEFESHDLKREKVVAANSSITVLVGPLAKGEYSFFGEFNPKTAQGKVVAK